MKALHSHKKRATTMNENNTLEKLREQFANFQNTMEELSLLKRVAADLRSYRRMIKFKRYD